MTELSHRRTVGGMEVDLVSLQAAADLVVQWASSPRPRLVVTPNADHFIRLTKDVPFAALYKRASLVTMDSAILRMLAHLEGGSVPDRVTGADLLIAVARRASRAGVPLILIGGAPGVADTAAERLRRSNPGLKVPLTFSPSRAQLTDAAWLRGLSERLAEHPVKVVALCLGSPKQERFFADLEGKASPALTGSYLCVGAAVDFAAGTMQRAPGWVQAAGLEWAFRLVREPRRLWRRYLIEDIGVARYLAAAAVSRLRRRGRS